MKLLKKANQLTLDTQQLKRELVVSFQIKLQLISLSKTGEEGTYQPCSFYENSSSVVSFDVAENPIIEIIGLNNSDLFRDEKYGLEDDEVVLNYYVKEENRNKVDETLIKIKRLYSNNIQEVYEASDGWYFENNLYNTTFYVEETEGRYIDFGLNGTTIINGQNMSGEVFFEPRVLQYINK